jgi:hypothetical protein
LNPLCPNQQEKDMFKHMLLAAALLAAGSAQAALSTGDLAFTSFNADEDGWSMVSFVDVVANSKVYFTDNEWNGSAFNAGESYFEWDTGAAQIDAGTVIRFSQTNHAKKLDVSIGSFKRAAVSGSTKYDLSQGADTLYAYLGGSVTTPLTFLAAISNGSFTKPADGVLTNTGLSVGAGAVQLKKSSDYAEYSGPRSGLNSMSSYKPLVSNIANWTDSGNGSFKAEVPDMNVFTVSAIPEPGSFAMLLAGLGLMGCVVRRRRA